MPYKDINQQREYFRRYKILHKKELSEKAKERYKIAHPPKIKIPKTIEELRQKKREKDRKYRKNHKEQMRIRKHRYYQKHKKEINRKALNELRVNINKRLAHNLRCRVRSAIKGNFKCGSAVKDLGCSIDFFKKYIEDKFTNNMTWDNYGTVWHLDHIIPLVNFNLSIREDFLKATHYTNYQPLSVFENLSKNRYLK